MPPRVISLPLSPFVMGLEEQQEEREVLESIFPEEITCTLRPRNTTQLVRVLNAVTDVSDTEFRVLVQLDDGRHEDEERADGQRTSTPPNPS